MTPAAQVEEDLKSSDSIAECLRRRAADLWPCWNDILKTCSDWVCWDKLLKAGKNMDRLIKEREIRQHAAMMLVERVRFVAEQEISPPHLLATPPPTAGYYSIKHFSSSRRFSEWSTRLSEDEKRKQLNTVAEAAEKLAAALEACAGMDKLAFRLVGCVTEESPLRAVESYRWARGTELPFRLRALAKSARERPIPAPIVTHTKNPVEARKTWWIRSVARFVLPVRDWKAESTLRHKAIAEIVNAMLGLCPADAVKSETVKKSLEKSEGERKQRPTDRKLPRKSSKAKRGIPKN